MMAPDRRRVLAQGVAGLAGAALAGAGLARGTSASPAASTPRVIEMTARRFAYEPSEIALKAGEPVVIAIRSLDFVHGMNIPDLKMRLDLVPGQVTRLSLPPLPPGVIDFLCDNFCGDGHERMQGRFVVTR